MKEKIEVALDDNNVISEQNTQNSNINQPKYTPESQVCDTVDTSAPVEMLYEMNQSMAELNRKVRGVDWFVMKKLGYNDLFELCTAFSAEQVDAIAMAIYQIEQGQALIIGDMVGVGKGRCAAAIMRYANMIGKKPIFFTYKVNLFSDIYRDIIAIGMDSAIPIRLNTGETTQREKKVTQKEIRESIENDIDNGEFDLEYDIDKLFKKGYEKETDQCIEEYRDLYYPNETVTIDIYKTNPNYDNDIKRAKRFVPFIINSREKKTDIKDENGHIIYQPDVASEKMAIIESGVLPKEYDCIMLTYSQVNSMKAKAKMDFINAMAIDNIVIMDESHNASGESNTGKFLQKLLEHTKGVSFLSATYAKRPDNMPVYAMKTSMRDTGLDTTKLISAIMSGGVALQEILSAQLVGEGQYMRRERSYEGINVNYVYLDESQVEVGEPQFNLKELHENISDKVTSIIRKIIKLQTEEVNPVIEELDKELASQQMSVGQDKSQRDATINNTPIFSGVFNLINQLLFSIKADAVADYAIKRMKEGKKPVIAFSSTLESFLDYLASTSMEDTIKTDFSIILKRRLEKILEYTIKNSDGTRIKKSIQIDSLGVSGRMEYESILEEIETASVGITISPIDRILTRIKAAGFTVGEVTGRNKYVEFLPNDRGYIKNRHKPNATDVFRKFNNNEYDCLLINQAGSTGASAHALPNKVVDVVNYDENNQAIIPDSLENKKEVKQRVMIVLQAELDINQEVQKRGRINRTGQVFKPIYDYVISAIPAEERLMMMLQKKLKSLDANTSSNQKQSDKVINVVDFLNIYGDEKVVEFLRENKEINDLTGNILKFNEDNIPTDSTDGILDKAHRVSGRVAILSTFMQNEFYNTMTQNYVSYEKQLRGEGRFNLEVEKIDLHAKTISKQPVIVGNPDSKSVFGGAVFLEKTEVDNLRKPYTKNELKLAIEMGLTVEMENEQSVRMIPTEYRDYLINKARDFFDREHSNLISNTDFVFNKKLSEVTESKSYISIKSEKERTKVFSAKKEALEKERVERLEAIEKSIDFQRRNIISKLSYFFPTRIIDYPVTSQEGKFAITGVVTSVDVIFNRFVPSYIEVRIALPNGIRLSTTPFSSPFINEIIEATKSNYEIREYREPISRSIIDNWDDKVKGSQSNRVIRYIVTGNILKAFGSNYKYGKLISYSTFDKKVKKGILMYDDYEPEDTRVSIPLIAAKNMIEKMSTNTVFQIIAEEIFFMRYQHAFVLELRKNSIYFKQLKADEELKKLSIDSDWQGRRGSNNFTLSFEPSIIGEVISYLYKEYKFSAELTAAAFEAIKDKFDVTDRSNLVKVGEEELLSKYEEGLSKYGKDKEAEAFEIINEKEFKKLDKLEKENYTLREENMKLRVARKLFEIYSSVNQYKKEREKAERIKMEEGGAITTISDLQSNKLYNLVTNSQDIKEFIDAYAPALNENDEVSKVSYASNIGGLFVVFADNSDVSKIYVYEGNEVPDLHKYVFEVYPENKYIVIEDSKIHVSKEMEEAKKYIDSNISSILRNANYNGHNFKTMVSNLYERLLDTNKIDATIKTEQLEALIYPYVKNASKIFSKEADFQGKGEVGKEYRELAKLKSYTFND
jgi:hypothetical protein